MDRRVVWTKTAWRDLEEIADYIARDSRHYAAAFVREVRDAARSLTQFSERGRMVPEFGSLAVREILVRNYRLVYSVMDPSVYVLGFVHAARDLGALWEREARPRS